MPSKRAVSVLLPLVTRSVSSSSRAVTSASGVPMRMVSTPSGSGVAPAISGGRSATSMRAPRASTTARSTTFSSSRTLPGHEYASSCRTRLVAEALEPPVVLGRVDAQEVLGEHRDVLAALAQRRHVDGDDVEAVVEILAEALVPHHRGRGPGWWRPRSARPPAACAVPPSRSNSPSCSTRRILGWVTGERSATSSRNSVPPSASSKRPSLRPAAPVNAPFS